MTLRGSSYILRSHTQPKALDGGHPGTWRHVHVSRACALWWLAACALILAACSGSGEPTSTPHPGPSILVGPNVDVSQAPYAQDEVSAAVDPTNPQILLAGSNDLQSTSVRVYGSGDGGSHWLSASLPLPSTAVHPGAVDQ